VLAVALSSMTLTAQTAGAIGPVTDTANVVGLGSGIHGFCALGDDGSVRCWGVRGDSVPVSSIPTPVPNVDHAVQTSGSCAVINDGTVRCWGDDQYGGLGNGTQSTTASASAVQVTGITNATEVTSTASVSCARLATGSVKCWGRGGSLGTGSNDNALTPVTVPGITTAVHIAASTQQTCALLADGTAVCWGIVVSATLPGLTGAVQLAVGFNQVCAIKADQTVWCSVSSPATALTKVSALSLGYTSSCAVVGDDHTVKCWGSNSYGEVGDPEAGSYVADPADVYGVVNATQVATVNGGACAVVDGAARCWGSGSWNGSGSFIDSAFPSTAKFHGAADDALALFARGGDRALWTKSFTDGAWSDWSSLGGILSSPASVAPLPDGGSAVVARGADNAIWARVFDGTTWSPWVSLGGYATSAPSVTANGLVVARGGNGAVWVTTLLGGGWISLGGYILGDPSAAEFGRSGVEVAAVGGDHALWVNSVSFDGGTMAGWQSLGGYSSSSPSLAPTDPNFAYGNAAFRLVTRGGDGALWATTVGALYPGFPGVFRPDGGWVSLGGYLTSAPAVVAMGGGRNFTFAIGGDGAVWQHNGVGWASLGGYATSAPAVAPII
jgi:hypothetical protein